MREVSVDHLVWEKTLPIGGLHHEDAARQEALVDRGQESQELVFREVLDHVEGENGPVLFARPFEHREGIAFDDVEATRMGDLYHLA